MAWGEALFSQISANDPVPGGEPRYRLLVPLAESLLAAVLRDPSLPPDQLDTFYYLPARMHECYGQFGSAEPFCWEALAAMEQKAGPNSTSTAAALNNLAQLLQATNRLAEAEPLMRRALFVTETSLGAGHPNVATGLNNLGQLLLATNRVVEAESLLRRALRIYETSFGSDHHDVACNLSNLGQLLKDTNRLAEAEPLMQRALLISEASFGAAHPIVAICLYNLAQLLQNINRIADAGPLMRRVVVILLRFTVGTGHDHPDLRAVLRNYAGFCLAMDVPVEEIWECMFEMGEEAGMLRERMAEILGEVFPQEMEK